MCEVKSKPKAGDLWKHDRGVVYQVFMLTNENATHHERWPVTVVYRGPTGNVWSRPLSDWHRSMKLHKAASEEQKA